MNSPKIFAGSSNQSLAKLVSQKSKIPLGKIDLGVFKDGEIDVWIEEKVNNSNVSTIKPKALQDMIHDHNFEIEAFNGYEEGHILMIAEIKNKEVSTLFISDKQETKVL